jgi:nickel/cobalt exporter
LSDEEHAKAHAAEAAQVTSLRDLLALGITGGLVPCPAGVTLVLFCLKYEQDKTARCAAYLTSFSLGLGSVLVAIATVMVVGRQLLADEPGTKRPPSRARDLLPVWTAALIPVLGLGVLWAAFDPDYAMLKAVLGVGGSP